MSVLKTAVGSKAARLGVAASLTAAALIGAVGTSSAQAASTAKATVSPAIGKKLAVVSLAVTGTGFKSAAGTAQATVVSFETAKTCPTTPGAKKDTAPTVVSATRLIAKTPNTLDNTNTDLTKGTAYTVCVYNSSNAVLGAGSFTVIEAPTVTKLSSAAGPGYGGQTITGEGTYFTAKMTAAVVDSSSVSTALTNIKVSKDNTSFTATTPVATPGSYHVVVTTDGGASAQAVANAYTYAKAISLSPSSGVLAGGDTLTIKGTGFTSSTFDFSSTVAGKSAVVFNVGTYVNSVATSPTAATARCKTVTVVSDTELVCVTPDITTLGADTYKVYANGGAFNVTLVNTFDSTKDTVTTGTGTAPTWQSVVSSDSAFTFSAF